MEQIILRAPTPEDEAAIWNYRRVFSDCGEYPHGTGGLGECSRFCDWLLAVADNADSATVRPGLVPSSTQMAIRPSDGTLVGFIDVRHELNDYLFHFGGHIGYSVLPSERRKGYAVEMFREALTFCRRRGMSRVLLTCDSKNEASRRTIRANGGVLENEIQEGDALLQRYWITL